MRRNARRPAISAAAVAALFLGTALPAAAQPILRDGSRGALVADWQSALNGWFKASSYEATRRLRRELGGQLIVDGVFGVATERATLRFQREASIPADGVVGLSTWVRWIGSNVTCCGAGLPSLHAGTRSAHVGWWQLALSRWLRTQHLGDVVVDGVYDTATKQATAVFQRRMGLPAHGRANARTWQAMRRQKPGLKLP
jgi:peptidoglycan hydrolase-like protein with peptidoglycan-binding domain